MAFTDEKRPQRVVNLRDALSGKVIPRAIRKSQALVVVHHVGFDGAQHEGYLVVHRELAQDIRTIFSELLGMRFPIEKITPIATYGWNDDVSMAENNTSGFNFRNIAGTDRLSMHAFGRAVDINPRQNPHISREGLVSPPGALHDSSRQGTIIRGGRVVELFKDYGFSWGGDWESLKDYMHFERGE